MTRTVGGQIDRITSSDERPAELINAGDIRWDARKETHTKRQSMGGNKKPVNGEYNANSAVESWTGSSVRHKNRVDIHRLACAQEEFHSRSIAGVATEVINQPSSIACQHSDGLRACFNQWADRQADSTTKKPEGAQGLRDTGKNDTSSFNNSMNERLKGETTCANPALT